MDPRFAIDFCPRRIVNLWFEWRKFWAETNRAISKFSQTDDSWNRIDASSEKMRNSNRKVFVVLSIIYEWTVLIARIVRSAKKIRSIPIVRLRLKIHLFSSGHHDYRPLLELLIFRVKSKGSKCPGFGRKPPSVPVVRTMLTRNFNCHRCYANWNG